MRSRSVTELIQQTNHSTNFQKPRPRWPSLRAIYQSRSLVRELCVAALRKPDTDSKKHGLLCHGRCHGVVLPVTVHASSEGVKREPGDVNWPYLSRRAISLYFALAAPVYGSSGASTTHLGGDVLARWRYDCISGGDYKPEVAGSTSLPTEAIRTRPLRSPRRGTTLCGDPELKSEILELAELDRRVECGGEVNACRRR